METPICRYRPSTLAFPETLKPVEYAADDKGYVSAGMANCASRAGAYVFPKHYITFSSPPALIQGTSMSLTSTTRTTAS